MDGLFQVTHGNLLDIATMEEGLHPLCDHLQRGLVRPSLCYAYFTCITIFFNKTSFLMQ